jgi:hypothetical protein
MAFISDPEQRRTWDPDRGYELKIEGTTGGSSGYTPFHLTGPDVDIYFYAKGKTSELPQETPKGEVLYEAVWNIQRASLAREDIKALITEAMLSYKHHFGIAPANVSHSVRFE